MEIIEIFSVVNDKKINIPLYLVSAAAGYPAPTEDDIDEMIDLNDYLIKHPASTFFAHVRGSNLIDAGISDGDILIVDTSLEPEDGRVVIASINNELTVKIYRVIDGQIVLQTDSEKYIPISIQPYMEFRIIGIITKVIHSL